jgi:hypothetical protein
VIGTDVRQLLPCVYRQPHTRLLKSGGQRHFNNGVCCNVLLPLWLLRPSPATLQRRLPTFGDTGVTSIATITSFVQATLTAIYPIGAIYTNATVATNPGTLLGFGTWTAFGAGRVMVGNGGGFSAGATGGSADAVVVSHTHTATVNRPRSHSPIYQVTACHPAGAVSVVAAQTV